MSSTDCPSILVVDDDEAFRTRLVRALQSRGFDVRGAASVEEALALVGAEPPEYAVVDLRIRDRSGLDVLRALLAADARTRVVVLTGYGSIATAVEAMRLGAVHYLTKPADTDAILTALQQPEESTTSTTLDTPSLARAEWEHINRVLVDAGGNISEAARRLGLHRRSLQRKLAKYPPPR